MEIDKIFKWVIEYLSDYIAVFVITLQRPASRFQPLVGHQDSSLLMPVSISTDYIGTKMNPKLFGFVTISIFVGYTLGSTVGERPPTPNLMTTLIVQLAIWFAYASAIHFVCKLLRGNGQFAEVVSITLQLLAVLYVVSNYLTFLWSTLAQTSLFANTVKYGWGGLIVQHPFTLYNLVHTILMIFYLPIALRNVERFGLVRQLCIATIPIMMSIIMMIVLIGSAIIGSYNPNLQDSSGRIDWSIVLAGKVDWNRIDWTSATWTNYQWNNVSWGP